MGWRANQKMAVVEALQLAGPEDLEAKSWHWVAGTRLAADGAVGATSLGSVHKCTLFSKCRRKAL